MSTAELRALVDAALQAQVGEEADAAEKNPALNGIIDYPFSQDAFEVATSLVASSLRSEKKLGVRILSELGRPGRPYATESALILIRLVEEVMDTELLVWVISALGNQGREEALPVLRELAKHPEPAVRDAVCGAISGAAARSGLDEPSIEVLVGLSKDPDDHVRFSATFELAAWRAQGTVDPRIAQALLWAGRDPEPRVARAAEQDFGNDYNSAV
jgi:HEAT repeat protein